MKFQVKTYPDDGWRRADSVIFDVEAETSEEAVKKAAGKLKASKIEWSHHNDPLHAVASLVVRDTLLLKEHKSWYDDHPPRITVSHYPYMDIPAFEGEAKEHPNQKEAVTAAFKDIRRQGVVARQNFGCCGSCASCAMPEGKANVFYHRQNNDAWGTKNGYWGSPRYDLKNLGSALYIHYSDVEGGDDRAVGILAMQAFQSHGLDVEWNGDPGQCLKILPRVREYA